MFIYRDFPTHSFASGYLLFQHTTVNFPGESQRSEHRPDEKQNAFISFALHFTN